MKTRIIYGQLNIVDHSAGTVKVCSESHYNGTEEPFEEEIGKQTEGIDPNDYGTLYVEFEITTNIIKNSREKIAWEIWTAMIEYMKTLPDDSTFGPFAIMKEKPELKRDIWFYKILRKIKNKFQFMCMKLYIKNKGK